MPIHLNSVSVTAESPSSRRILNDVSCFMEDGTITLLVGQTGAGKSTLLHAMCGLADLQAGEVQYDNELLWRNDRVNRHLVNRIGIVFQSPEYQLFANTVAAEFAYSLRPLNLDKTEVLERTRMTLEEVGLPTDLLPLSPLTLSGGQKRRVALATTLATQPHWLFMDEPTAGLDSESSQQLVRLISERKRQMGGIVIVTHDLDEWLSVADSVIVLANGRVVVQSTPADLCNHPDILLDAGVGLPSRIRLRNALLEYGIDVHTLDTDEQIADSIVEQLRRFAATATQKETMQRTLKSTIGPKECVVPSKEQLSHPLGVESKDAESVLRQLDPRAKWVSYMLVSVGVLMQHTWVGVVVSALIAATCVKLSGVPARQVLQLVKPFLYVVVFSVALSGLRFSDVSWHWHAGMGGFSALSAMQTFKRLSVLLAAMVLGVLLPTTTSQLDMKRGLEQSLRLFQRVKLPVEAFSLAASLTLRFIPVLMSELQRFARIAQARGKSVGKRGVIRIRDVPAIVIPLFLSVLQLGDDLSTAMEARGYRRTGMIRTSSRRLQFSKMDARWMGIATITLVLLLILSH